MDEHPNSSLSKMAGELSVILNRSLSKTSLLRIGKNREVLMNMRDVDPNRVRIMKDRIPDPIPIVKYDQKSP